MVSELVGRLRARAELNIAWDKWELGDKPVPPPLLHAETARHLSDAADRIESLSRQLKEAREALKAENEACARYHDDAWASCMETADREWEHGLTGEAAASSLAAKLHEASAKAIRARRAKETVSHG